MTLGEFRERTELLDDETELLACSSLEDSLENLMNIPEMYTPDFYPDPIDESKKPVVILVFNSENLLEDI